MSPISAGRRGLARAGWTASASLLVLLAASCSTTPPPTAAPSTAPAVPSTSAPASPASTCAAGDKLVPPCGAYWGMYIAPPGNRTPVGQAVGNMESQLGRKLDIVFSYHDMSTGPNGTFMREDEVALGRDRILLLSWEAKIWGSPERTLLWRDIASGTMDASVIDKQAQRIKKYGKPVMIGFDGEMDRRTTSGTPKEYVAAYRHIHDRFQKLGVTNVIWVWAVTGFMEYKDQWKALYPGDEYVDWISYDPYNFATCRGAPWKSFDETLRPTYDWFQANGFDDKPIIIGEYGTEVDPRRPAAKADWFRGIPAALKTMPNIKALLQWNAVLNPESPDGCDFRLEGPGVVESFAEVGRDPYLNQRTPG
ncbi:glycoside hydrolase family 26 protein [Nonomuraea sp. NPDC059023]|uniref:glycoside hydrolase family 26 protein n=1 Tax=unclassified Nonomuraea TaxID=2593643 RepID=UPI0036B859BB